MKNTVLLLGFMLLLYENTKAQKVSIDSCMSFIKSGKVNMCSEQHGDLLLGSDNRPQEDTTIIRKVLKKASGSLSDHVYIGYFVYLRTSKRFYRIYVRTNNDVQIHEVACDVKRHRFSYKIHKVKNQNKGLFSFEHVIQREKNGCTIMPGDISTSEGGVGILYDYKQLQNGSSEKTAVTFKW